MGQQGEVSRSVRECRARGGGTYAAGDGYDTHLGAVKTIGGEWLFTLRLVPRSEDDDAASRTRRLSPPN